MALPLPHPHISDLAKIQVIGRVAGSERIRTIAVDENGVVLIKGDTNAVNEFTLMRRELERMSALLERLVVLQEAQVGVV